MCGSFHVFHADDVIALLTGITRHVIERFAFSEQHFEDVARL